MKRAIVLPTLAFSLASPAAFAQISGVGTTGPGLLASIISWFMSNIAGGLIDLGIIGIGCAMILMHFRPTTAACVVVGALVVTNYLQIAGVI